MVMAESLMVGATDFDGLPMSGVAFTIEWDEPNNQPVELVTDDLGQLAIDLPTPESVATVRLADNRFQTAGVAKQSRPGDRLLMFSLFGTDPEAMGPAERESFAQAWGSIVTAKPAKDSESRTPAPEPARLGAFLEGYRRESTGDPFVSPADTATSGAVLTVKAVNTRGAPVAGAVVYLFGYDESSGTLRTAGSARTNGRGVALFSHVVPNRYHRAEVSTDDGLMARTTILVSRAKETVAFPVVVLRPPGETITGLVFDGEEPARGTMIQTIPAPGRSPITSITDSNGYFSLGPVRGGEGRTFVLMRNTTDGPRMALAEMPENGGEALVPFHLISRPGSPGN
ncbi:MAG: hypothetical protein PWP23_1907 [Candidatus Sumerlaeota bacterium]|nr:hypothetical protein [Candidatus Sumerlaeota bacterium]